MRRILTITAILSAIVAALTLYGQNVGNFVTQVDTASRNRGLALSIDENFSYHSPRIVADPISNMDNITLGDIPNHEMTHEGGQHNGPVGNWLGLTFYLKNIGNQVINYQYAISITGVYKNVDAAMRLALISDDEKSVIYSKGEYNRESGLYESEDSYKENHQTMMPATTTPYVDERIIAHEQRNDFLVEEVHKYTVLIWLEGHDPDCIDDIKGGSIKLVMTFKIV